ncbi:MAG: hypothetical protein V4591_04290 [Bdellovibrionota bacterium]
MKYKFLYLITALILYSGSAFAGHTSIEDLCDTLNKYSSDNSNQNIVSKYIGCWKAESMTYSKINNDSDFTATGNYYIQLPDYFVDSSRSKVSVNFPVAAFLVFDPGETAKNKFKLTTCFTNMGISTSQVALSADIKDFFDTDTKKNGAPKNKLYKYTLDSDSTETLTTTVADNSGSNWKLTFLRDKSTSHFVTNSLVTKAKCPSPL